MRCFIAVDMPENIRGEIVRLQSLLPEENMKKVEKNNLHLTLAFFGEITEQQKEQCGILLRQIEMKKFNASIGQIGFFPSRDYIRVVWVSLEPEETFKNLNHLLKEKLNGLIKLDPHFEAHVTLARVKSIADKEGFLKKVNNIKTKKEYFEVDSFKLKKSTLTKQGPIYEDLLIFNLA